jgi:hypothetical protein
MMDFLTRINAVLHHEAPDQVPFAPYDNLVPRGEFVRKLRNRGMGLWGATDDETERSFKAGTLAIMEAIEEYGNYPIQV